MPTIGSIVGSIIRDNSSSALRVGTRANSRAKACSSISRTRRRPWLRLLPARATPTAAISLGDSCAMQAASEPMQKDVVLSIPPAIRLISLGPSPA